jgi:hypothetical protein
MTPSSQRFLILSGSTRLRYPTLLNHRVYADRHGYRYRFDISPRRNIANPFFHKLKAIADALQDCEWLFWIDDDAAFTQIDTAFETLMPELQQSPQPYSIFCNSPVNRGMWTYLSSGNFFIHSCSGSRELIDACLRTNLEEVERWWNIDKYGLFTNGDQDTIVYQIESTPRFADGCLRVEYTRFNTRPFHFEHHQQHFLVHFTNVPDMSKREQMRVFAARFGLNEFLVSDEQAAPYAVYQSHIREMIAER